jgi:hypothetical protein
MRRSSIRTLVRPLACMAVIAMWFGILSPISEARAADDAPAPGDARVKSVVAKKSIVRAGEPLLLTASYDSGRFSAAAYCVGAYKRDVPKACKNMGWKTWEEGDAKFHSYYVTDFQFLSRTVSGSNLRQNIRLDTARWPLGDYRLRVKILFYDSNRKEHYRESTVLVSVVE